MKRLLDRKAWTHLQLFLFASLLLSFLLFGIFIRAYSFLYLLPLTVPGQELTYRLNHGMTLRQVAADLSKQGILRYPRLFVWQGYWSGYARHLQAGEYRIGHKTTPAILLENMAAGKVIDYQITFIEGWTFTEISSALRNNAHLVQRLSAVVPGEMGQDIYQKVEFHLPVSSLNSPEGLFFPDTYQFTATTTDIDLLRRAHRALIKRLNPLWEKRADGLPYKNSYEALIVASLIEKETALMSEKPIVAAVIVNRLNKNMLLQIDPTVIYGLGIHDAYRLTRKDLEKNTPYNTYLNKGLPPTPIAIPSLSSLEAALHPASVDVLYFVAKGDGTHVFSSTLAEQEAAVKLYQSKENNE